MVLEDDLVLREGALHHFDDLGDPYHDVFLDLLILHVLGRARAVLGKSLANPELEFDHLELLDSVVKPEPVNALTVGESMADDLENELLPDDVDFFWSEILHVQVQMAPDSVCWVFPFWFDVLLKEHHAIHNLFGIIVWS